MERDRTGILLQRYREDEVCRYASKLNGKRLGESQMYYLMWP